MQGGEGSDLHICLRSLKLVLLRLHALAQATVQDVELGGLELRHHGARNFLRSPAALALLVDERSFPPPSPSAVCTHPFFNKGNYVAPMLRPRAWPQCGYYWASPLVQLVSSHAGEQHIAYSSLLD